MQGDLSVIEALNAVALQEITCFEVTHAREHLFQRRKYKKLQCWFDDQVHASRKRRRYLTDRCFELDGIFQVALTPTAVDPAASIQQVLADQLELANGLLAAYQAAYVTSESAGDNRTADKLCAAQGNVEQMILDLEAFASQIKDLGGVPPFLLTKV